MAEKTGQDVKWKMVRSVHEVAKYTKIHITYNILISKKNVISGNPSLVQELLGTPAYTVQDYFPGRNKEIHWKA